MPRNESLDRVDSVRMLTVPRRFVYRNWRGEVAERRAVFIFRWFGRTSYEPDEQWFIRAYCLDKDGVRDFAEGSILEYL